MPLVAARLGMRSDAMAAAFVTDIGTPFVAPADMAAALFDLTPAEARVFALLVARHSLAETAAALGVERTTVKTHLARLYDKIGVRRQSDLVQVAVSFAPPVAQDRGSAVATRAQRPSKTSAGLDGGPV